MVFTQLCLIWQKAINLKHPVLMVCKPHFEINLFIWQKTTHMGHIIIRVGADKWENVINRRRRLRKWLKKKKKSLKISIGKSLLENEWIYWIAVKFIYSIHWSYICFMRLCVWEWEHIRTWNILSLTLQTPRRSKIALRPMLAATITSSWFPELPAATALVVAVVIGLVYWIRSSAVAFLSGMLDESYTWMTKKR